MKKFKVIIEESIVEEFEVEAEDSAQALKIAEQKYKDEEFVLSPGEVTHKQMAIMYPEVECTEWIAF